MVSIFLSTVSWQWWVSLSSSFWQSLDWVCGKGGNWWK